MDENSAYEERRKALIEGLRARLDASPSLTSEVRELFESTIAALEELTKGVDSAHIRIALRKKELQALDHNLKELALAIRDVIDGMSSIETFISKRLDQQDRRNKRFYLCMGIAWSIIIAVMSYVAFGSRETVSVLSSLAQALKLVDIII